MNIFQLAELELIREGKNPAKNSYALLDKAVKIRKWLDLSDRNKKVAQARYKLERSFQILKLKI